MAQHIELKKRCISSMNKSNSDRELALVETGNFDSFLSMLILKQVTNLPSLR